MKFAFMKNTIAQNIWKPGYLKIYFDTFKVLATSFYRLRRVYFQYRYLGNDRYVYMYVVARR